MEFSGIVVTYNEGRRLADCLKSLQFCDELLVIDLGSTDDSVQIANRYATKVIKHRWVPVVEEIKVYAISLVRNDWVIFLDPDEVFPNNIIAEIRKLVETAQAIAYISLPWQFYFLGCPLHCTIWGNTNRTKGIVFHKERVKFSEEVHQNCKIVPNFTNFVFPRKEDNIIKHYWIDSYRQLFEKHWRYIQLEGKARYKAGKRFSYRYLLKHTINILYNNLFPYKGICGGWNGIFLSLFYAWYEFMSLLSLYSYQRSVMKIKP